MLEFDVIAKYKNWIEKYESQINTYANHLIVIFAFSVPTLISVRRISVVLLIFLFLVRGRVIHHLATVMRDPLVASFALYFLVHVVWLIGSDEQLSAIKSVHDASFLLFVPLFATFLDKVYVKRVVGAFILGMFVSAAFSYGIFFGMPPSILHNGTHGVASNPTPLWHHIPYSYMLVMVSIIILYKIIRIEVSGIKILPLILLFLFFSINIFILEARTGYILFFILTLMVVAYHFKFGTIKSLIIASILMLATFILVYSSSDVFKKRVDLTVDSSESLLSDKNYNTSIGARVGMVVYATDIILENIILGNGTGDDVSEVRKRIAETNNESKSGYVRHMAHTHNEYISSLLQFGMFGFLVFLNIPFQMLRYSSASNGVMLKTIGVSILLYSLTDVFIIGLGMILTVAILSSVSLSKYYVTNTFYEKVNIRLLFNYLLAVIVFYAIKAGLS